MMVEARSNARFMHKTFGELFIAYGTMHRLWQTTSCVTPADSECEEYTALCGYESQSWSMPSQGIQGAEFIKTPEEGEKAGAKKCVRCFGNG